MAEGILRKRAAESGLNIIVASAGTHGYHIGEPPDSRAVMIAKARSVNISAQRARKLSHRDFNDYDIIVALDSGHYNFIEKMNPGCKGKLHLLMSFTGRDEDVPDPYYDGEDAFIRAFDMIDAGIKGLIEYLGAKNRL